MELPIYPLYFFGTGLFLYILLVIRRKLLNPEKSLLNSALSIALYPIRGFGLGPYRHGGIFLSLGSSFHSLLSSTTLSCTNVSLQCHSLLYSTHSFHSSILLDPITSHFTLHFTSLRTHRLHSSRYIKSSREENETK